MTPLNYMSQAAHTALLAEVGTTPKPGLVDRHDNGAHTDMCYDTFAASTEAIVPYITQMSSLGLSWDKTLPELFLAIRPIGVEAEQAMFQATGGVNTHRGMIFSMGIISSAAGYAYRHYGSFNGEQILALCPHMTYEILERDFAKIDISNPKTHGERLYAEHGWKGIRGEAQSGYISVKELSLPLIRELSETNTDTNAVYLQVLLHLMAHVDDTNVLIRTDAATLEYEKQQARRILDLGGSFTPEGLRELASLNEDFIQRNISPGGCADLLAVTIYLHLLEGFENVKDSFKEEETHENN